MASATLCITVHGRSKQQQQQQQPLFTLKYYKYKYNLKYVLFSPAGEFEKHSTFSSKST